MAAHLRDLSTALAAAVPALLLTALAMVCAVLGVAVMVALGVTLAGARTVLYRRAGARRNRTTREDPTWTRTAANVE